MSVKLPLNKLSCLLILVGTVVGVAPMTVAQSINIVEEEKDIYQDNEKDPAGEFGNIFNPMDLMHRSNLQRSRNASDFAEDTSNNLNKAAEEFKLMQQQRLQQQIPQSSSEPTIN